MAINSSMPRVRQQRSISHFFMLGGLLFIINGLFPAFSQEPLYKGVDNPASPSVVPVDPLETLDSILRQAPTIRDFLSDPRYDDARHEYIRLHQLYTNNRIGLSDYEKILKMTLDAIENDPLVEQRLNSQPTTRLYFHYPMLTPSYGVELHQDAWDRHWQDYEEKLRTQAKPLLAIRPDQLRTIQTGIEQFLITSVRSFEALKSEERKAKKQIIIETLNRDPNYRPLLAYLRLQAATQPSIIHAMNSGMSDLVIHAGRYLDSRESYVGLCSPLLASAVAANNETNLYSRDQTTQHYLEEPLNRLFRVRNRRLIDGEFIYEGRYAQADIRIVELPRRFHALFDAAYRRECLSTCGLRALSVVLAGPLFHVQVNPIGHHDSRILEGDLHITHARAQLSQSRLVGVPDFRGSIFSRTLVVRSEDSTFWSETLLSHFLRDYYAVADQHNLPPLLLVDNRPNDNSGNLPAVYKSHSWIFAKEVVHDTNNTLSIADPDAERLFAALPDQYRRNAHNYPTDRWALFMDGRSVRYSHGPYRAALANPRIPASSKTRAALLGYRPNAHLFTERYPNLLDALVMAGFHGDLAAWLAHPDRVARLGVARAMSYISKEKYFRDDVIEQICKLIGEGDLDMVGLLAFALHKRELDEPIKEIIIDRLHSRAAHHEDSESYRRHLVRMLASTTSRRDELSRLRFSLATDPDPFIQYEIARTLQYFPDWVGSETVVSHFELSLVGKTASGKEKNYIRPLLDEFSRRAHTPQRLLNAVPHIVVEMDDTIIDELSRVYSAVNWAFSDNPSALASLDLIERYGDRHQITDFKHLIRDRVAKAAANIILNSRTVSPIFWAWLSPKLMHWKNDELQRVLDAMTEAKTQPPTQVLAQVEDCFQSRDSSKHWESALAVLAEQNVAAARRLQPESITEAVFVLKGGHSPNVRRHARALLVRQEILHESLLDDALEYAHEWTSKERLYFISHYVKSKQPITSKRDWEALYRLADTENEQYRLALLEFMERSPGWPDSIRELTKFWQMYVNNPVGDRAGEVLQREREHKLAKSMRRILGRHQSRSGTFRISIDLDKPAPEFVQNSEGPLPTSFHHRVRGLVTVYLELSALSPHLLTDTGKAVHQHLGNILGLLANHKETGVAELISQMPTIQAQVERRLRRERSRIGRALQHLRDRVPWRRQHGRHPRLVPTPQSVTDIDHNIYELKYNLDNLTEMLKKAGPDYAYTAREAVVAREAVRYLPSARLVIAR